MFFLSRGCRTFVDFTPWLQVVTLVSRQLSAKPCVHLCRTKHSHASRLHWTCCILRLLRCSNSSPVNQQMCRLCVEAVCCNLWLHFKINWPQGVEEFWCLNLSKLWVKTKQMVSQETQTTFLLVESGAWRFRRLWCPLCPLNWKHSCCFWQTAASSQCIYLAGIFVVSEHEHCFKIYSMNYNPPKNSYFVTICCDWASGILLCALMWRWNLVRLNHLANVGLNKHVFQLRGCKDQIKSWSPMWK